MNKMVRLSLKWAMLRHIPNDKKKVAIIFHNYPPRDDRIGTAFGLDSPVSVLNIMKTLKDSGYIIEWMPKSGQALIDDVKSRLTLDRRWRSPEPSTIPLECSFRHRQRRTPQISTPSGNVYRSSATSKGEISSSTIARPKADLITSPVLAAELVNLKVDLITTRGTPAALAAKSATRTIPVVMAAIGEAVETGVVASIAHPGGNITGLSSVIADVVSKRLELLSEMVQKHPDGSATFNRITPSAG